MRGKMTKKQWYAFLILMIFGVYFAIANQFDSANSFLAAALVVTAMEKD